MSFRRIVLGLLTFWVGLMGFAFGTLFLICLSLYLLWHGLSISIIIFGGLFLACIILVQVSLRSTKAKDKPKLPSQEPALISEERSSLFELSSSSGIRDKLKRPKIL
jgi:hypothetical protein